MAATSSPKKDKKLFEALKGKDPIKAEYPPELLAARRDAFLSQLRQRSVASSPEAADSNDEQIRKLLESLQGLKAEYPPQLLAARRAAVMAQYAKRNQPDRIESVRLAVQTAILKLKVALQPEPVKRLYASLIVALMVFVTILGSSTYRSYNKLQQRSPVLAGLATHAQQTSNSVCQPGGLPSECIDVAVKTNQNLSLRKNGLARPAVSNDSVSDATGSHQAALVNDGVYGKGSRWIGKSANSWLKIDLGQAALINVVALIGRDRVGNFSDSAPGHFEIAIALSDNVYANGDSNNDGIEYQQVFDSKSADLANSISDPESVTAYFEPVMARFVKITFTNPGEAVDEVEVFLFSPSRSQADDHNRVTRTNRSPNDTSSFIPTLTPKPAHTFTATSAPTSTLEPTSTFEPTDTPWPSNTPTVMPTETVPPTDTPTDVPPTDTPEPPIEPILTDEPPPIDTPTPISAVSTAEPMATP